jgi:hypothetical protein
MMSEPKAHEHIYMFEISEENLDRIIYALADSGRDDEPLFKWLVDVRNEGPWRVQAKTFGAWKMEQDDKEEGGE